ncbi:hypothetical protein FJY71_04120 [candidate division WOR-3 bacterium]|nr:hypothetical protein [candidate division WOR-3 bacterium]
MRPVHTTELITALWVNASGMQVYCAGAYRDEVVAINCATDSVTARTWVGHRLSSMLSNPLSRRLYCLDDRFSAMAVLNDSATRVLHYVPVADYPTVLCLNTRNNKLYAASSYDGRVTVVSCDHDSVLATLTAGHGAGEMVYDLATNRVFCAGHGGLVVIDGESSDTLPSVPVGRGASGICGDAARGRVITADSCSNTVSFVDCAPARLRGMTLTDFRPCRLGYSARGKVYCGGSGFYHICVIDPVTCQVRKWLRVPDGHRRLFCLPNGQKAYSRNLESGTVSVIDCVSDSIVATLTPGPGHGGLCYSPELNRLYIGGSSEIGVIDCSADTLMRSIPVSFAVAELAYGSQGRQVFALSRGDGVLAAIAAGPDTVTAATGVHPDRWGLCHIPGHNYVACGSPGYEPNVLFVNAATLAVVDSVPAGSYAGVFYYHRRWDRLYVEGNPVLAIDCGTLNVDSIPLVCEPAVHDTIADFLCLVHHREVAVVACSSNAIVARFRYGEPWFAAWSPETRRVFVSDGTNDCVWVFRDSAGVGIGGAAYRARPTGSRQPTIVRGVLRLGAEHGPIPLGESGLYLKPRAVLLDAAGRKVMDLRPSDNDVRQLAPGVYFVMEKGLKGRGLEGSSRVVVVAR